MKGLVYRIITYVGIGFFFVIFSYIIYVWAAADFSNANSGIPADLVLGQSNFTGTSYNGGGSAGAGGFIFPTAFKIFGSKLYTVDNGRNRVVIWNTVSPANGANADIVLGHSSFVSSTANDGHTVTTSTLNDPSDVYSDGTRIYVADTGNNRVLIWSTTTPANGADADIVIGQDSFLASSTNKGGSISSSTLSGPTSVFTDGSKLYVADTGNHRVLIWNTSTPANGSGADIVLGQANFTSGSTNGGSGTGIAVMAYPRGVYKDNNRIYVLDASNNRILIWNTTSPLSGASADVVLGQVTFTAGSANRGSTANSSTLSTAAAYTGIFSDNNNIFVVDHSNHRILVWTTTTPSSGSSAQFILGKNTFTDSNVVDFDHPAGVFASGTKLYMADNNQNRVLRFEMTPTSTPSAPAFTGVSTSTLSISSVGSGSNVALAQYALYDTVSGQYLSSSGALSGSASWVSSSTWPSISVSGLSPGQAYTFKAKARYIAGVETALSSATNVYTLANSAGTPIVTASSTTALSLTIDVNGNSTSTQYAIYNITTGNYTSATGTSSGTPAFQTTSSWSGVSVIGLSANTAYQFRIIAQNQDGITAATSTTSTAAYTLASVPSAVSASAGSTSIILSWSGNATEYYAENITASSMTGWISTSQATFSGLSCGTSYTFQVKGKNGDGTETAFSSSVSVTTTACSSSSGGGFIPAPVVLPANAFIINDGGKETFEPLVTLSLYVNEIKEIAISNMSDFVDASFIPYKSSMPWTLSPGAGQKNVYIKFRGKSGAVSTMFQTIKLLEKIKPGITEQQAQNQQTNTSTDKNKSAVSGCPLIPGTPYKIRTTPDVWYVTSNCTRRPFKNPAMYLSYFSSWKDILIVSKEQFASVPADTSGDLPFGPLYKPDHGTFIRMPSDPTIYYVLGNKKIVLGSEKVFTDLGYKKEWIVTADRTLIDKYELLKTVTSTVNHLDLTLVKYPSSPKIYMLEYGKKRHITDENARFHNKPFRFERVIDIRDTEMYQEGEQIKT